MCLTRTIITDHHAEHGELNHTSNSVNQAFSFTGFSVADCSRGVLAFTFIEQTPYEVTRQDGRSQRNFPETICLWQLFGLDSGQ